EEGPGQADPLPLAAREVLPALGDRGRVPSGHRLNLLVDRRQAGGVPNLLVGHRTAPVADVLGDRSGEQERGLADVPDELAERPARDQFGGPFADGQAAATRVGQAEQRADEARLPTTR